MIFRGLPETRVELQYQLEKIDQTMAMTTGTRMIHVGLQIAIDQLI